MTAVEEPGPAGSRAALADALRKAMNAAGMRQAELAKQSGLAPATVSYSLNRNGRVPTIDTLNLLAQALDISGESLQRLHLLREHSDARTRRLDHYLAAAARAAAEHPYPGILPGTQPALPSVYLGQRVARVLKPATNTEEANARPEEAGGPSAILAEQVLATVPCIVLAGPGGGKSSLLRSRLAHGVARWQSGRGEATLPVLISAASLLDRPLPVALAEAVTAYLASYGLAEELPADFFAAAPVKDTRWLVLVDGLDEVTDAAERARIVRGLAAVQSEQAYLYTIVIASRPLPVDELKPMGSQTPRYELLPFDEEQTEDVALRWMQALNLPDPEDTTLRFTQALHAGRLAALARVPLMLSMLCHLWANDPGIPLPANRTQIYADFIALLNERAVNPASQQLRPTSAPLLPYGAQAQAAAERTLDHLSLLIDRLAASRQNGSTQTALDILLAEPAAARPTRVPAATWSAFLRSSLRSSGLVTEHAGDFIFLHQTLQEFCAARHAARTPQDLAQALKQFFAPLPRGRKSYRLQGVFNPADPWLFRRACSVPDRELTSFVGFVLDAALQCAPRTTLTYLHEAATGRAGVPGVQFLAEQRHLGTTLPNEILRAAAETCVKYARNRRLPGQWRIRAARALWRLEDARAWDVYTAAALDPGIGHDACREAALDLVTHSPLPESERAKALAAPSRLNEAVNVILYLYPTEIHDERSADFFAALAINESIDADFRMRAARVLLKYGDVRGADLCVELTQPHHPITSFHADVAKEMLKCSDPRGADILIRLVRSNTKPWTRISSLVDLICFGHQAAPGLCEEVVHEPAAPAEIRVAAAELLFWLDVDRCRAACFSLLQSAVEPSKQLRLGRRLAFLGEARGVELCATLAEDAETDEDMHSQAVNVLRDIAYPEEAGLGTAIAAALVPALRRRAVQALTAAEAQQAD